MSTVLITGSHGFTGRYFIALCKKQGFHTVGLTQGIAGKDEFQCDLKDLITLKRLIAHIKPTYILHLAALSFIDEKDQQAFYAVNVLGTENLLTAIASVSIPPQKIIIASSANVYGNTLNRQSKESDQPMPTNHYAISKLAMEHMARTWFNRLPIIITRPFNYTGPGQDTRFLVPKIVNHFQRKQMVIELGNLAISRDFSDVRDVVAIYLKLMLSDSHSEIINICSGNTLSLNDILNRMQQIAGYSIEVLVNPALIRSNEIKHLAGDPKNLHQRLAFSPHYTFEETLTDIYQYS